MPHGVSRKGLCTISTKIEEPVRDELDRIANILNLPHRSSIIKVAIIEYINEFNKSQENKTK